MRTRKDKEFVASRGRIRVSPSRPDTNAARCHKGWLFACGARISGELERAGFGRSELWDRRAWGTNSTKGHRATAALV